jgi:hypothetical protein
MSILTSALNEPKAADGVTFEEYHSARESLGVQIGEDYPDSRYNNDPLHDSKFEVELTGDEISGIFLIERSMQARLDMKNGYKDYLFWNAVLATTLLFVLSLAGLRWSRSSSQEASLQSPAK